jgi:hypothetical protein
VDNLVVGRCSLEVRHCSLEVRHTLAEAAEGSNPPDHLAGGTVVVDSSSNST